MTTQPTRVLLGAILALATSLTVSLATAATKYAAAFVSVEQIIFCQYLVCVLIMLPSLARRRFATLKTDQPWLHLARSASGWLCFYTYYLALARIPIVDAALLRNCAPICVPLLLLFWKGYRLPPRRWLPVLAGFIGIALVLRPQGSQLSLWHLVALASAVTLAGSIVTTRALAITEPTTRIIFYYFAFSALCSLPLAASNWRPIPLTTLPLLIAIGLSIWLTMWLYTRAYSYAGATVISPISYSGVLFTGLLGWLIWSQVPSQTAMLGAILIISGGIGSVWLGHDEEASRSRKHRPIIPA